MLSYDDALARILAAVPGSLPAEPTPLDDALGRALAHDVLASGDLPPFANSAVDGYAVRAEDTKDASPGRSVQLMVTQTIPAGHAPQREVGPGEAARIYTGAPLPSGADALVMVEDTAAAATESGGDAVQLRAPGTSAHVRHAGSDLARGALALSAGTTLDAGAIGLLAALNVSAPRCPRRPRVALLTTGDEVVPPGDDAAPLAPGQIRDANGPALRAALREAGAHLILARHTRDTGADVRHAFDEALAAGCDVLLVSGGVSVGDYDVVKAVVQSLGRLDFWRIAIKPGKPLAFGCVGNALFFGLPGNPVSSLVTFELFVRPLLRRLAGHDQILRPQVSAVLSQGLPHERGRREFARARLSWENDAYRATPTGVQASHRLASLTGADALLVAHEEHGDYAPGERLPALLVHSSSPDAARG